MGLRYIAFLSHCCIIHLIIFSSHIIITGEREEAAITHWRAKPEGDRAEETLRIPRLCVDISLAGTHVANLTECRYGNFMVLGDTYLITWMTNPPMRLTEPR